MVNDIIEWSAGRQDDRAAVRYYRIGCRIGPEREFRAIPIFHGTDCLLYCQAKNHPKVGVITMPCSVVSVSLSTTSGLGALSVARSGLSHTLADPSSLARVGY